MAYDLDKTILSVNSSRLVVQASRRMGFLTPKDYRQAIYYSILYKFDLQDANKIVLSMMKWLRGLKESEVRELIQQQVTPILMDLIRPEIRESIKYHRSQNARIIMLSSAMPYLCQPVANHLEMDDVICSSLEVTNDHFTGHANGNLIFGKEKARRIKAYSSEHGFPLETTWYYGDAYTDRFILQIVGNPVCVKPEIKLGWMAKRRGWRVI